MAERPINTKLVTDLLDVAVERSEQSSDAIAAMLMAGVSLACFENHSRQDVLDFVNRMYDGQELAKRAGRRKTGDA